MGCLVVPTPISRAGGRVYPSMAEKGYLVTLNANCDVSLEYLSLTEHQTKKKIAESR